RLDQTILGLSGGARLRAETECRLLVRTPPIGEAAGRSRSESRPGGGPPATEVVPGSPYRRYGASLSGRGPKQIGRTFWSPLTLTPRQARRSRTRVPTGR